jgi:uncharacterized protein YbjT (DUF2867 family)
MVLKIVVIGSTGYVGFATVNTLSAKHGGEHKIFAGVRDVKSEKSQQLAKLQGVIVVNADFGQPATLRAALQDADSAYLVIPGAENRVALACGAIDAAKEAKVKHLVVLSVMTVEQESIFGTKQFTPIEKHTKEAGIPYTFLRVPLFMDNYWGSAGSIGQGAIYGPARPDAMHTPIAIKDFAEVAAQVLTHPAQHVNQAYSITTKSFSHAQLAQYFSLALNKEVKYVQVPYEGFKKSMMEHKFPEWQVDGIGELYKMIDADNKTTNHESGDIKKIIGREPTTVQQWIAQNAAGFGGPVKKIGILGTGNVAKFLALGYIKHGWEVTIGTRDPSAEKFRTWLGEIKGAHAADFKGATAYAHSVILAVGFPHVESVISLSGGKDAFKGKLLIDVTNPINGFGPTGPEYSVGWNSSGGEKIQAWLPDAYVVKCWNIIGHAFMIDPPADKQGAKPDMWIAGNEDGAVLAVKNMLIELGWSADHIIGTNAGIKACRWLEPMCQAWVNYAMTTGSWKHGFALLRFS